MILFTGSTYEIINNKEVESIFLYSLEYDTGQEPLYWTSYDDDVTFDSKVWTMFPIQHEEIVEDGSGQIQDVNVTVANAESQIQYYVENYSLMWKKFSIWEIFIGTSEYIQYNFMIKDVKCKKDFANITLSSGVDILAMKIPNRHITANYCPWQFKGTNCLYTGSDTICEKTFNDCKKKINLEHFGGYPALVSNNFYF